MGLTGLGIDGGIAVVGRCMARALDELTAQGRLDGVDHVLLLDDPEYPPAAPLKGSQVLARGSQIRFAWQLWRTCVRTSYSLVLFDFLGLARTVRLPAPGFPPPRYAIFVHGIELNRADGQRAAALRGAERILVNSRFTADWVERVEPSLRGRIHVVELCIDPEKAAAWAGMPAPTSSTTRARAALIVARMASEERGKGHEHLIRAWPAVREAVPGAELWIVGGGDDREYLEAQARTLGLDGAVRFFGRVSDARLRELYSQARLFAMPSSQEGFGLVYAEAMWHGLPCIGSTRDAAGQVIADGETGILVPYGDLPALTGALIRLLEDPQLASRMGRAATEYARRQFTYERFRQDLLAALDLG